MHAQPWANGANALTDEVTATKNCTFRVNILNSASTTIYLKVIGAVSMMELVHNRQNLQ